MDPLVYVAAATVILILIILLTFLRRSTKEDEPNENAQDGGDAIAAGRVVRRREAPGGGARRRGPRNRMAAAQLDQSDEEEEELDIVLPEGKVGAKKMRKLEEKAERKRQREIELKEREEKKKRDAKIEEQRKKEEAKREAEEAAQEEADKLAREEQEKRDHEEYLKLKEAFTVEEEGEEVVVDSNSESLLQEFIDYIKSMKVVMLEDLAVHFKIRTQDAINRVNDLIEEGRLTGVLDDRGKFIYITRDELEAVAKFIKQRGRVSITELAESSNLLINLNPDNKDVMHKKLLGEGDATVTA